MILAVGWILFCFLMLMGIVILAVEYPTKLKRGLATLVAVLLFVGMSWGFDRVDEIKGAMERENASTSASEN